VAKRVWLFQQNRDKEKLGVRAAPWYVGWYEGARKRSKKVGTKTQARQYANRLETAVNADQFSGPSVVSWQQFRSEYQTDVLSKLRPSGQVSATVGLDHYQRLMRPKLLSDITRQTLSRFATKRLAETYHGKPISRATVNRDLRQLRAFLREAVKRRYLAVAPPFDFLKEPRRIPTSIDEKIFCALYENSGAATVPSGDAYSPSDWWQAYLVMLFLTGWRAMEPLSVPRKDIDWDNGRVFLRAEASKGRRDELVPLHPLILDHLQRVQSSEPMLLPWPYGRRRLWDEFHRIQDAAGIKRSDGSYYGFHDLRRGFATLNAGRLSADVLQRLMRHRHYTTTQRYINLARQLNPAIQDLFVPTLPERDGHDSL